MNWNIAVDGIFLFQSSYFENISHATTGGEHVILADGDDFRNSQTGIEAGGKKCAVAIGFEDFEDGLDLFGTQNFGFSGHVNKTSIGSYFVYSNRLTLRSKAGDDETVGKRE